MSDPIFVLTRLWYKSFVLLPQEAIYVVIDAADNLGFGLAVAEITKSDPHCHKITKETYTLIAGQLWVHIEGQVTLLKTPGESIQIPVGTIHWAESADPENPALISVLTTPAWTSNDHILVDWPY